MALVREARVVGSREWMRFGCCTHREAARRLCDLVLDIEQTAVIETRTVGSPVIMRHRVKTSKTIKVVSAGEFSESSEA